MCRCLWQNSSKASPQRPSLQYRARAPIRSGCQRSVLVKTGMGRFGPSSTLAQSNPESDSMAGGVMAKSPRLEAGDPHSVIRPVTTFLSLTFLENCPLSIVFEATSWEHADFQNADHSLCFKGDIADDEGE